MEQVASINKILNYEMALIDNNVSSSDLNKYMEKISALRENLFYSYINKARKNKDIKQMLIDDAIRFIQVEEVLLTKQITNSQFSSFLQSIYITYENLYELDTNDILLNNITTRLNNVIYVLRTENPERVTEIYQLLYKISEMSEKVEY